MRDYKHIHEEQLQREDFSWKTGWAARTELTILGMLWGAAVVVAVMVFWP